MEIDIKFNLFKFGAFHNPIQGIKIRENKGLLSNMILGFWDLWPLMIKLSFNYFFAYLFHPLVPLCGKKTRILVIPVNKRSHEEH